jgi:hypothetical protein
MQLWLKRFCKAIKVAASNHKTNAAFVTEQHFSLLRSAYKNGHFQLGTNDDRTECLSNCY